MSEHDLQLGAVFVALLPWLASAAGTFLASHAARYVATKVLLIALMTTVLPVVLMNVIHKLMEKSLEIVNTAWSSGGGGSLQSQTISLSGLAAYLATELRLAEALALVLTAVAISFTLRLIPFVRL